MKNQGCSTSDMKECWKKLLKGALIGGLVMFAWLSVSWMVLPWHKSDMMTFKNNAAVSAAVKANAPKSGIYTLTPVTTKKMVTSKAAKGKKVVRKAVEVSSGPTAFVAVNLKGFSCKKMMKACQGWQFLLCLVNALILTSLLKCCGGSCPVKFSALVGLVVGTAGVMPNWVWMSFPTHYTLVNVADQVIAFALAGSVIVRWVCTSGGAKSGGTCSMK